MSNMEGGCRDWRVVAEALDHAESSWTMAPPAPQLAHRLVRRLAGLSLESARGGREDARRRRRGVVSNFDCRSGAVVGSLRRARTLQARFATLRRRWHRLYGELLETAASNSPPPDEELLLRSVTFAVKLVEWTRAHGGGGGGGLSALCVGAAAADVYGFSRRRGAETAASKRVDEAALARAAAADGFPVPMRDARLPALYLYVFRAFCEGGLSRRAREEKSSKTTSCVF